jgi:hypothetical protein
MGLAGLLQLACVVVPSEAVPVQSDAQVPVFAVTPGEARSSFL